MARLIRISAWSGEKRGNVIFVHGLGGHPYDTWKSEARKDLFWPLWLAEDVPGIAVFSYGYSSPPMNWLGTAMPILDEAAHALQVLLSDDELNTGPLTFVCHSLGGLIVKQILRIANERSSSPEIGGFLNRVRQVVFIATPHTGSGKANLLARLSFLAWPSDSARDLVANSPQLRDLNFSYRELAARRSGFLNHLVYYEMANSFFGRVVEADASDPGLPGCIPTPINADHVGIAKPPSRDALVYVQIRKFIAGLSPRASSAGSLVVYPYQTFEADRSLRRLIPRLSRLAVLVLLLSMFVVGIPKLLALLDTPDKLSELDRKIDQATELIRFLASQASENPNRDEIKRAAQQLTNGVEQAQKQRDPRSKQLDEALDTKNAQEAERIFRQIASDAVRSDDNVNAATALRSEAALNRFTNVAKASKLYAKAAELQPNDYDSWIDAGDTARSAGKYTEAIEAYKTSERIARQSISSSPNDLTLKRRLYSSLAEIGQVYRALGDAQNASQYYSDAASIAKSLVDASPNDPQFKRDMSIALEKAGHVFYDKGDYSTALERYRESLEIAEQIADPSIPYTQRDVAVAWSEVAASCIKLNNFACGVSAYKTGVELLAGVVQANPWDREFKLHLLELCSSAGRSLFTAGNTKDAQKYFERGRDIALLLARSDPSNASVRSSLLTFYGNYGDFLLKQRRVKEAFEVFSMEVEGSVQWVNSKGAALNLLIDLSATYYQMGEIKRCQGDLTSAMTYYRAGIDVLQGVDGGTYKTAKANFELNRGRVSLVAAGQHASCDNYR